MSKTNKESRDRILRRWASSIDMLAAEIDGTRISKIGIATLQRFVVLQLQALSGMLKHRISDGDA